MLTHRSISDSGDSAPDFATDAARYEAVRRRDTRADGRFYYSVATTGVYCRPSCPSRLARRENVGFHATAREAEEAGFRACKRCRPGELPQEARHARIVDAVRERIDASDETLTLAQLAAHAGVSPHHLHRLFKKHVGMTPGEYASAHRLARVGETLREASSVTAALHDAGYSSSSRFYELDGRALGMKPSDLRRGAKGISIRAVARPCSLGRVLVAATDRGVCAISLGESDASLFEELRVRFPRATIVEEVDVSLDSLANEVVAMIDAARLPVDLPLDLVGTAFQRRVWRALREIPRGETRTYSEIAKRIGSPNAARAVGAACAGNPVAVAVPCHRVVREDGSLGGYRWGLERKRRLLAQEHSEAAPIRPDPPRPESENEYVDDHDDEDTHAPRLRARAGARLRGR